MAFDAGTIEARLTVDVSAFNRDLRKAKAEAKAFADKGYKVKISAVFDNASTAKARTMFAQLDQAVSKDAMNRLRSSPQGSVLGSLNALFSPHKVTGAPSASQAGQQGLLGQMLHGAGTGNGITQKNVIKDVIGVDQASARAAGAQAGKDAADAAQDSAAKEVKRRGGIGSALLGFLRIGGGSKTTVNQGGALDRGLLGGVGPGILGVGTKVATIGSLGAAALGTLPALGAIGAGLGVVGGGAAAAIASNAKLKAQAESTLKDIEGIVEKASAVLVKPLQQAFASLGSFFKQIGPQIKGLFAAAAPLIAPLTKGLEGLVSGLLPGLTAILKAAAPAMQVFAGFLSDIGSGLGQMFKAFAPAIGPSSVLLKALLDVVTGLLPVVGQLASIFARSLAPIFVEFAGVIKSLLPIFVEVGKIIAEFAKAVFGDLSSALSAILTLIKGLAPSFAILAKALSQVFNILENSGVFAILGDALEQIAPLLAQVINTLIEGLAPVLPTLIQAIAQLAGIIVELLANGLDQLLVALIPIVGLIAKVIAISIQWLAQNHLLLPVLAGIAIALEPIPALILGLVIAAGYLVSHWKQIWQDIKNWTDDAINFIKQRFDDLAPPIRAVFTGLWDAIKVAFAVGVTEIKIAFDIAKAAFDVFAAEVKIAWDVVVAVFKVAWAIISAGFKAFIDILTGNWAAAGRALETGASQAWNAIRTALGQAWNAIRTAFGQVLSQLENAAKTAWSAIGAAAAAGWNAVNNNFVKPIENGVNAVIGFFRRLPGEIVSALSGLGGELLSLGRSAISGLISGITSAIPGGGIIGSALHAIGLAEGGILTEPVIGFGVHSGRTYTLAENGPEAVIPRSRGGGPGWGGASGGPGNAAIISRLDKLIDTTAAVPAGVGRHVGSAISGSAADASFRTRYPHGGY